jgi:hypothetical protein
MKQKNKRTINAKRLLMTALAVFMLISGIVKSYTEERSGIIVNKRTQRDLLDGSIDTYVYINTKDDSRIPDYVMWYPENVLQSPIGGFMDFLLEQGVKISFEDEGATNGIQVGGYPTVNTRRLLSIDGIPMTEWFPGSSLFPYATNKVNDGC